VGQPGLTSSEPSSVARVNPNPGVEGVNPSELIGGLGLGLTRGSPEVNPTLFRLTLGLDKIFFHLVARMHESIHICIPPFHLPALPTLSIAILLLAHDY